MQWPTFGIKRRKLLINPRFQLIFILWMIGIALAAILVFYGANLYLFLSYVDVGRSSGLAENHVYFRYLSNQYNYMNGIFLVTAILAFILIFVVGLILSHRVAGPLERLKRHMNDIADGKPPSDVSFRKGDFFQELPGAYNRHLATLLKKQER